MILFWSPSEPVQLPVVVRVHLAQYGNQRVSVVCQKFPASLFDGFGVGDPVPILQRLYPQSLAEPSHVFPLVMRIVPEAPPSSVESPALPLMLRVNPLQGTAQRGSLKQIDSTRSNDRAPRNAVPVLE